MLSIIGLTMRKPTITTKPTTMTNQPTVTRSRLNAHANAMRRTSHLAMRPPNTEAESGRSGTRRKAFFRQLACQDPDGVGDEQYHDRPDDVPTRHLRGGEGVRQLLDLIGGLRENRRAHVGSSSYSSMLYEAPFRSSKRVARRRRPRNLRY